MPKSDKDCSIVNDYFHTLSTGIVMDSNNINAIAEQLSASIYDYFKLNYGSVKESDQSQLEIKYNNHTTRKLKKDLKHLKDNNAHLSKIKSSKVQHKNFTFDHLS